MTMQELKADINEVIARFETNAAKAMTGNNAAAARSRRDTTTLEKLFKEWRRQTIAEAKKDQA